MIRTVEGNLDAAGLKIGLAVAGWNKTITDRLLEGAVSRLEALGAEDVTVLKVPGALELPVGVAALARDGCNAVVAIGTVIKGDTDHYEIVVRESTAGVARVAESQGVPVANAILAVRNVEDAVERSGPEESNKGAEAVDAAVAMANALRQLEA